MAGRVHTATVGGIAEPDHSLMPPCVLFDWYRLYTGRGRLVKGVMTLSQRDCGCMFLSALKVIAYTDFTVTKAASS